MGSFSFLRADRTTRRNNLTMGDSYKILVPDIYGGGYIKDKYFDYGYINHGKDHAVYIDKNKHIYELTGITADLYGVLAYWNNPEMVENLKGKGMPDMLRILLFGDTCDQPVRCKGIDIGCYDDQIDKLKYPLKLVSVSYKGTYEECEMRSYGDHNQGFYKTYWED